jgi:serine/threonine protein phosphatase PrpC
MNIDKIIEILTKGQNEEKAEGFVKFLAEKLWNSYNDYLMDKVLVVENEIKSLQIVLPNAKEYQPYDYEVKAPHDNMVIQSVTGLEKDIHGLTITVAEDGKSFKIQGTPSLDFFRKQSDSMPESNYELTIKYVYKGLELPDDRPVLERKISLIINQDPRNLWKNMDVDWDNMPEPKYIKEHTQVDYVKVPALEDGTPQKDIVAASKRGRSHAQEGKPRDDHFKLYHDDKTNWYVIAVADGAGSAKFSREGSRIACDTVIDYCKSQLENCEDFEEHINTYNEYKNDSESDARKLVGDYIYKIVGTAAFKAQKAIFAEADKQKQSSKLYATTLLLTICKKFSYGWFIASFWVGDGAICLYSKENHTAKLLGIPDEGEYAGQTRFLTMPEIFKDATSLYQRLRFNIVPDFTALFLMSDGVSDPKFETDANLNNPDKWDNLWNDLINNPEHPVDLSDDNEEAKNQLLDWLDFWSPGNHDDRTIAILY